MERIEEQLCSFTYKSTNIHQANKKGREIGTVEGVGTETSSLPGIGTVEGAGTETSSLPIADSVDARRDGVVVPPPPPERDGMQRSGSRKGKNEGKREEKGGERDRSRPAPSESERGVRKRKNA